jgi:ferredoxin-NADP reductase
MQVTATTLALIIFLAIAGQVVSFALLGLYRRRRQLREIERRSADEQGADVAPAGQAGPGGGHAWEGFREFVVLRRVVEDDLATVCSFYLAPLDGKPLPAFRPGQFLTFDLLVVDPATGRSRTVIRCYSLSDRPHPDHYRVTIKRVPPPPERPDVAPGLSSNFFHDHIKEGSRLLLRAPAGHFHLSEDQALPVVLIAGGIGITPMLSILNSLLAGDRTREVWLFYGVRNGREQIMKDHLRSLAASHPEFHLHLCYSRPDPVDVEGVDYQHLGHVDLGLLRSTLRLARYQFYVCGPRPMMESIVPRLREWGVAENDIHYESFGPASLTRKDAPALQMPEAAHPITVTFSRSGKSVRWDAAADSLLAFAEANGIEVESGCRAGSCGTCQTRIESGEVAYGQQADADVSPGHCLLCICLPKSDLTLAA